VPIVDPFGKESARVVAKLLPLAAVRTISLRCPGRIPGPVHWFHELRDQRGANNNALADHIRGLVNARKERRKAE